MKNLTIPADTTPEAAWMQMQYFRQMSFEERFLLTCRLSDAKRAEVAAKVREKHPDYSAERIKFAEIRLRLGDELFSRVYPDVHLPHCGTCCDSLRSIYNS